MGNFELVIIRPNGKEEVIKRDLTLEQAIEYFESIDNTYYREQSAEYRTAYAEKDDITFILKETQDENGDPVSTEVVGFYYGAPDEDDTARYIGALKAEY